MEVIGYVGTDVRSQPDHKIPGHLRAVGKRSWSAQFIAGEEPTDINLIVGGAGEMVVAEARREVPILGKVVVKAHYREVVVLRKREIRREAECVDPVAEIVEPQRTTRAARSRIGGRHIRIPHLLYVGIDPDAPRIKRVEVAGASGAAGISRPCR